MKCDQDKEQVTRYISNEMTDSERNDFEWHLAECAACSEELETSRQLFTLMGEMPAPRPSADMPVRFQAMLEEYKGSVAGKKKPFANILAGLKQLWTLQPRTQLAYSIVLAVLSLGLGFMLNRQVGAGNREIAALSLQVHEMKEMMMLSLLENPSASERIKGVSFTSEIKSANKEVVDALFSTLNNDPNVNVRLVTLEALSNLANDPAVREGLVQSIAQQDSPLVQSALADAMLKLQEKRSVTSFKKLLEQKSLNTSVRLKIEKTINRLI